MCAPSCALGGKPAPESHPPAPSARSICGSRWSVARMVRDRAMADVEGATRASAVGIPWRISAQATADAAAAGEGVAADSGTENDLRCLCRETAVRRRGNGAADKTSTSWHMPQQSDRTASSSVILVERRPQSLARGDPCGASGIDPVAQPGSGAMMPLRVRCDPQLPYSMRQREHRDEATGVLPATFLNETIWPPS